MSTGTLMTEGATTSQPDASPNGEAAIQGQTASTEQQTDNAGQESTSGDASSASAVSGEDTASGGEPDGDKTGEQSEGAPDNYADFAMPEGLTLDDEVGGELKAFAKEHGLTQAQAQAIVDMGAKLVQKTMGANDQALADVRQAWADETRSDPEIGGARLEASLANARKAMAKFASPAFIDLLNGSGLGNHPEFVRTFDRVGAAISEDTIVTGNSGGPAPAAGQKSAEELFYPSHAKP